MSTSKANLKVPSKTASRVSVGGNRSVVRSKSKYSISADSRSRLRQASGLGFRDDGNDDDWMQEKEPIKPDNQLDLTEAELKQEFTRILRADNPKAPDNIVRFSYKDLEYKQLSSVEQCDIHFALDGNLLHVESDEARRILAKKNMKKRRPKVETKETGTGPDEEGGEESEPKEGEDGEKKEEDEGVEGDGGDGGEEEGEGEGEGDEDPAAEEKVEEEEEEEEGGEEGGKVLRNQFNFSERASQTFNYTVKDKACATEPPPQSDYEGSVTQWEIYDAYVAHKAKQDEANQKKKVKDAAVDATSPKDALFERATSVLDENASIWAASAKIVQIDVARKMERMINQNTFDDVLQDFRYWDDASDAVKTEEGSLLPLWTFRNDATKKKHVTALSFNPAYTDLITVGYGSYNFSKQEGGGVACFTLKNPTYPEYQFLTDSGVMAVDCHPTDANLLVAGFYDGSVAVYDLRSKQVGEPKYKSTVLGGQHSDPVWQVKWQADDLENNKNFFSISSDGRVKKWTCLFTDLVHNDIVQLPQPDSLSLAKVETESAPAAAGTCFSFNSFSENLFVVGSEEGKIHMCSKAYSSKFLSTSQAHNMVIYATSWNPFHQRVYATCSADWTLKIWDQDYPKPVFQFDLGNPVGDIAWAPYSSTVFAAITTDSRVHVFDLSKSKYHPLCVQPILKKGRLTHVEFNAKFPILIVGDDRGAVSSLKLSPNLRKDLDAKNKPTPEAQKEKLEKLLSSVKELNLKTGKPIGA